jgi:hypothetical protein
LGVGMPAAVMTASRSCRETTAVTVPPTVELLS